ncbi:MAG: lycopene cyclase domain-containing protein [Thermoplasmatota archaeon]
MYLYLYLNILIIFFPLVLSFDKKVRFHKRWLPFLFSFLTVGVAFILWDVYATAKGHWSFNEEYIMGVKVMGLPVEEIMFFFTVPYACLFTYESLSYYLKDWKVLYGPWPYVIAGALLILSGLAYLAQGYTTIVLVQMGLLSLLLPLLARPLVSSRIFWVYIVVTLGLFLLFNMVLTAVPVVRYGPEHIWGGDGLFNGRFFTIPLEDFFYNISMLVWYLLAYRLACVFLERHTSRAEGD